MWISCSSYRGLSERDCRKEGAWGRYLLIRRCLLVWRHLLGYRYLRKRRYLWPKRYLSGHRYPRRYRYLLKCRYLYPLGTYWSVGTCTFRRMEEPTGTTTESQTASQWSDFLEVLDPRLWPAEAVTGTQSGPSRYAIASTVSGIAESALWLISYISMRRVLPLRVVRHCL